MERGKHEEWIKYGIREMKDRRELGKRGVKERGKWKNGNEVKEGEGKEKEERARVG